jgi:signal peptidase II
MNDDFRSQVDIFIAILTVSTIVFLDRITKIFLTDVLSLGESLPLVNNVLHMTLVHNTGIAFGLFKDHGVVFIIIAVIAAVLLVYNIYFYKSNDEKLSRLYIVAFSLILGGTIGNLIDRIVYGHVIDFIDFRIWPVFNIADSAITVGALIIAVNFICFSKQ